MHSHEVKRLFITLNDIGLRRSLRRLRYLIRIRFDLVVSPQLAAALCRGSRHLPSWSSQSLDHAVPPLTQSSPAGTPTNSLTFTFLNESHGVVLPIDWKNVSSSRLWLFNLHYFDWAREWLNSAIDIGVWPREASLLCQLFDDWIIANPPGRGDGWHSYTLSLRTRNWIKLFRCCPSLATPFRLESLWQQLCWLQSHPENWLGGNHWIENLTALAVGGLQFEGSSPLRMYLRSMHLLERELSDQILSDGGHQERSASYHLIILDRLVELGETLDKSNLDSPQWLISAILRMSNWAATVRLEGGGYPAFNDCDFSACRSLDSILAAASSYLRRTLASHSEYRSAETISLNDTGWTFLRPGRGWELIFKFGNSCPPHLPAHAHSDLLSFDLYHNGQPIIAEVGTSTYDPGARRLLERSSSSHNTIQLGAPSKTTINWVEPVDVWGVFRAGRKAKPFNYCFDSDGIWHWASGCHDGYSQISSLHFRWLAIRLTTAHEPVLVVLDFISTSLPHLFWRSWLHLGPGISPSLQELGLNLSCWQDSILLQNKSINRGSLSAGFGNRYPRIVLNKHGSLSAGTTIIASVLAPANCAIDPPLQSSESGLLKIHELGIIQWHLPQHPTSSCPTSTPQVVVEA